jgi:hypothetical protein
MCQVLASGVSSLSTNFAKSITPARLLYSRLKPPWNQAIWS